MYSILPQTLHKMRHDIFCWMNSLYDVSQTSGWLSGLDRCDNPMTLLYNSKDLQEMLFPKSQQTCIIYTFIKHASIKEKDTNKKPWSENANRVF